MLEKENALEDAYLLLQVHDELVYEIRSSRLEALGEKIKEIMESVLEDKETHKVPITVVMKTGSNWGAMQELGTRH